MLLIGSSTLDYLDLADAPTGRRGATAAPAKPVREEGVATAPVPAQAGTASAWGDVARRG